MDEFETENAFKQYLESFSGQNEFDTLVVQCNHKGPNLPHILHAQHIMEMRDTKQVTRDDVEAGKIESKEVSFLFFSWFNFLFFSTK